MGLSESKDKSIDIYLEVDKQCYESGQIVKGKIYLNIKQTRPYKEFWLILYGKQKTRNQVQFQQKQSSGRFKGLTKSRTRVQQITNQVKSYDSRYQIYDFQESVQKGQYQFNFQFLLPKSISGTLYHHPTGCYIRYFLRAVLFKKQGKQKNQFNDIQLNIIQPPRKFLDSVQIQNIFIPKFCQLLFRHGPVGIKFRADKNFVRTGDFIQIEALIDNSQGRENINLIQICLVERVYLGNLAPKCNYYNLHSQTLKLKKGNTQNLKRQLQIPKTIITSTLTGKFSRVSFVIQLRIYHGCCKEKSITSLQIQVQSQNPQIFPNKKLSVPKDWYPKQIQTVANYQMKPFFEVQQLGYNQGWVYEGINIPSAQIPIKNEQRRFKEQKNQQAHSFEYFRNISHQTGPFNIQQDHIKGIKPYFL